MNRIPINLSLLGAGALLVGLALTSHHPAAGEEAIPPVLIGDGPVIRDHLRQPDIEAGRFPLPYLLEKGLALFVAPFNSFDGAGRPEASGDGNPTPRPPGVPRELQPRLRSRRQRLLGLPQPAPPRRRRR